MVQVIKSDRGPLIHVHYIERGVFGNGIAVKVYGEMKIGAKDYVYAKELKLKTIQVLVLTPETGNHVGYHAQKWIYHKGEFDNYASVDIFNVTNGTELGRQEGPDADGSIWLDFIAMGE